MYRQIRINQEDLNYQRIFWRYNTSDNIQEYQLKTVTYGMAASPFLAIRALQQLAKEEIQNQPSSANVILNNFYVDDLLTGCDSVSEAQQFYTNINSLLESGGFKLSKWASNDNTFMQAIPEEFRETQSPLAVSNEETVSTLGIIWHPRTDQFGFIVENDKEVTKRTILSKISKLFDPMGWLSPSIILGKILIQELWLTGFEWDEPIPSSLETKWNYYYNNLKQLQNVL